MTCAFLGNPRPTVTLYKGDVNITANSKFWYNSTSGVCTIVIPTCTLKDSGEYSVLVENELGKDRSSCALTVYGEGTRRARLGAGRRPCVPSGPEAQDGRLGVHFFIYSANRWCKHFTNGPYSVRLPHPLDVICYMSGASRLGSLQSLGRL